MGVKTRKLGNVNNSLVQWQAVKTGDFTAVAGEGYFVNTTGGAITITLPTPQVGDKISLKDYARTWNTNKVTTAAALTDGTTNTNDFDTQGQTVSLVYMDGTKGWSIINEDTSTALLIPPSFITATGGTVTTSGDFKIHSFTGDSNFVVSAIGNNCAAPTGGPKVADYLVVAGGGGGGSSHGAGGGGGGFRESKAATSPSHTTSPHTVSPLAATTGITVAVQTYPITVGGGGTGSPGANGTQGSSSVFSTITSAGGGKGGSNTPSDPHKAGGPGGSGGGAKTCSYCRGLGNQPPVSPPQGKQGGPGGPGGVGAGGGGGATACGASASGNTGGVGGAGGTTHITGSPVAYSGGGGGQGGDGGSAGGTGGGGTGVPGQPSVGGANTGGGGGGNTYGSPSAAGGKGIVIIRYKFQ